ncbi:leucine-rich repeat-containing protein 72 isoform X2 [Acipenser ruthenus]|uniref:leucine-rich repeat-containing protein 72 isoform X2 n=1 Tax=Acipenser ruthenus TaxID=7906 RepID=UPI0027423965|nr:leucine-rich repeat-containing protein 72 isoform X2 [Acipenser ruthenus]
MASCEKVIQDQLQKYGFKREADLSELYLANKGLIDVTDLSRFQMLKYLWLNNNKIKKVHCLNYIYRLTELYLHNNDLTNITGSLSHLKSLQVLMLHNNQLTKLVGTVSELKGMQFLKTLKVKQEERNAAFSLYNAERACVLKSLAFGRRVKAPLLAKARAPAIRSLTYCDKSGLRRNQKKVPLQDPDAAVLNRAMQRSLMQYSSIDWNTIPSSEQKRLEDQPSESPKIITVKFR